MDELKLDKISIHFIVGSARSGTTLLSTIFNQHSEVLSTTENDFLLYFLCDFFNKDIADAEVKKKLAAFIEKRRKRGDIDSEYVSSLTSGAIEVKTYNQFCKSVYLHYGKKYFGKTQVKLIIDKNPTYTLHIKKLMDDFPDSKFIALVRDYRDVISSQKRFFSLLKLIPIYGYMWTINNELIYECHRKNPDKILLVKYEDMVNSPEKIIKEICGFLKIAFEPEMLNYYKNLSPVYRQINENLSEAQKKRVKEMFTLINQPVTSERIGSGKKGLSEKEIRIADFVVGETATKFGYLPKNKFNFFETFSLRLLTFPIILMSRFQIRLFNYYYYYLSIRTRKIAENFNIPLVIKRWLLVYKK